MTLKVVNGGELLLLEWAMTDDSTVAPENLSLKLYTNDYVPVDTTVAGSLTEATFTGYSAKTLSRGGWTGPSTNAQGKAEISYPEQSWDATSAETVYGYFVIGATSGTCVWAERFAGARALGASDTIKVVPKLTFKTEY